MLSEPDGLGDELGHFKALCVVGDKAFVTQFCYNVCHRNILIIVCRGRGSCAGCDKDQSDSLSAAQPGRIK